VQPGARDGADLVEESEDVDQQTLSAAAFSRR
jgi:hypothetical protein